MEKKAAHIEYGFLSTKLTGSPYIRQLLKASSSGLSPFPPGPAGAAGGSVTKASEANYINVAFPFAICFNESKSSGPEESDEKEDVSLRGMFMCFFYFIRLCHSPGRWHCGSGRRGGNLLLCQWRT
jgi:hypothetical protein